jgi:hypothetical protein
MCACAPQLRRILLVPDVSAWSRSVAPSACDFTDVYVTLTEKDVNKTPTFICAKVAQAGQSHFFYLIGAVAPSYC